MFSDNEDILNFFQDGVTENTETEIDWLTPLAR
jgi:hypothetical protein